MLGRQNNDATPAVCDELQAARYKRNIFDDMKKAIDLLKNFNDSLNKLHPDIVYRIRGLV